MTATWIATPQEVERVIAAVLPHTTTDEHLPMICCVNLEVTEDGRLIAVATDRYTLGVAWASFTDWMEDAAPTGALAARVFAADLKRLLAFLRPHRKTSAVWTLTDGKLTAAVGEESIAVRTVDVNYTDWRKLLGGLLAKRDGVSGPPVMGLYPRNVAKFLASAKALGVDTGVPMTWHMGPTGLGAPFIRIGEHFVGVLMPVRLADEPPQLDLTALGIEQPAAVAS